MIGTGITREEKRERLKLEAGYRTSIVHLKMVQEAESLYGMRRFDSAKTSVRTVSELAADMDRELFLVMSLNAALQPIAVEVVAMGGIDTCYVDMRNVFKHAILCNASEIICFHNHPSGQAVPSLEDCTITRRISRVAELLDMKLYDHTILGRNGTFFSFKEEHMLDDEKCEVA